MDRDGDQDLLTANAGARDNPSTVSVLKNDGGAFRAPRNYYVDEEATGLYRGDFDGDLDVATANGSNNMNPSENVSVPENAGDGTLGNHQVFEAGAEPRGIAKARLDGDTEPDLAVANYGSDDVSVLRNITP